MGATLRNWRVECADKPHGAWLRLSGLVHLEYALQGHSSAIRLASLFERPQKGTSGCGGIEKRRVRWRRPVCAEQGHEVSDGTTCTVNKV